MIPPQETLAISAEGTFWQTRCQEILAFKVSDDASYAQASELCKIAKSAWKALDDRRKQITQPILQAKRSADELFRPPLSALEAIEDHLKSALGAYSLRQTLARTAAMHAAAVEIQAGIVPTEIIPERPTAEGVSVKEVWDFEVVDPDLVPRDLCTPDAAKIKAKIWYADTPHKAPQEIPGLRFFLRPETRVRT